MVKKGSCCVIKEGGKIGREGLLVVTFECSAVPCCDGSVLRGKRCLNVKGRRDMRREEPVVLAMSEAFCGAVMEVPVGAVF